LAQKKKHLLQHNTTERAAIKAPFLLSGLAQSTVTNFVKGIPKTKKKKKKKITFSENS
jgi:hypothetical protein